MEEQYHQNTNSPVDGLSSEPLLTKLYVPPVKPDLVRRQRLVRRLEEGMGCKLTLLSAPAGFGKTTALSEWVTESETPVAWVSLEGEDNDPARFLAYVVAALGRLHPGVGEGALEVLQSLCSSPVRSALATLINEIAATITDDFALVLDDYHSIEAREVHEAIAFLLDHLPPQMHLVIASRSRPPLPVARLRATGQLTELSGTDLRLTHQEVDAFLREVEGLELPDKDIASLESRTEGWAAGLRLVALATRGREDVAGFVTTLTGSHRYVMDYLSEEVLDRQDQDVRDFLVKTSILDRLSGELGDALTGREDGQEMVEHLERANLFLVALDDERRWYRYHHLFSDFLRRRLGNTCTDEGISDLHSRASEWFEGEGLAGEAIDHALAGGESGRAAGLVGRVGRSMLLRGEVATVKGWLDALPGEVVGSWPQLSLFYALIYLATGRLEAIEAHLQSAEDALEAARSRGEIPSEGSPGPQPEWGLAEIPGNILAIQALTVSLQGGDAPRAIHLANWANELLTERNLPVRSITAASLGNAYREMGEVMAAIRAFTEALEYGQEAGNTYLVLLSYKYLGELELAQGRLLGAEGIYLQALRYASVRGGEHFPAAGMAYVGLGELLCERNELEDARGYLEKGISLGHHSGNAESVIQGLVALGRVEQAQGDLDGAIETLWEAKQAAQERHSALQWESWVEARQARLWAAQGNLRAAARWERECGLTATDGPSYLREFEHITLARVLLARGETTEAAQLLQQLFETAEAGERMGSVIEILVVKALALRALCEMPEAVATLRQAVSLAEPEGYVRIFVGEGSPMAALLQKLLKAHKKEPLSVAYKVSPGYVGRLLEALGRDTALANQESSVGEVVAQSLTEPLSERELEVLGLLGSGASNLRIAGELFVSVNTVKSHLKHIYRKLGTHTRTQTIARARELNLV